MNAVRDLSLATCLCLLTASAALAGPPLSTDDAGTVEAGRFEVELNGTYGHDRQTASGNTAKTVTVDAEAKISTGLSGNLGLSLAVPYLISERTTVAGQTAGSDGFGDMALELKYAFAEVGGVKLAVKPSVTLPTGAYGKGLSEGRWQFGGTLIATREFAGGAYALHANLGYEHHDYRSDAVRAANRPDLWSGSIAGEAEIAKGVVAGVDVGLATARDKGEREPAAYALAGLRYDVTEHVGINCGVRFGVTGPETDVAALYGVVVRY